MLVLSVVFTLISIPSPVLYFTGVRIGFLLLVFGQFDMQVAIMEQDGMMDTWIHNPVEK